LDSFKKFDIRNASNKKLIEEMAEMANFANLKSQQSHKIWVELNDSAFVIAMLIGIWTLIFNCATNCSGG